MPLRGLVPGANPPPPPDPNEKRGILGTAKDVVGKLADIFFIAHHAPSGPVIAEEYLAEGEDEGKKEKALTPAELEKEIENYFEESGLDKVFEETAEEIEEEFLGKGDKDQFEV